jgi:hypothetical protein
MQDNNTLLPVEKPNNRQFFVIELKYARFKCVAKNGSPLLFF